MKRRTFADWLKENYIIDYYKIGIANRSDEPIRTIEVDAYTDQEQLNNARQAHAVHAKHVFAKPATEQEFRDYSDGKEVPFDVGPITPKQMLTKSASVSGDGGLTLV